jgi:HSP20 family protein
MAMLMRTDPFRDLDRVFQLAGADGSPTRPAVIPMDAYRSGDTFVVHFDLPGVDPASIDIDVERNMLTVKAQRQPQEPEQASMIISERPRGTFTRQLMLGQALDTEHVEASYDAGVLSIRIPVADKAKPRKIEVTTGSSNHRQISGETAD